MHRAPARSVRLSLGVLLLALLAPAAGAAAAPPDAPAHRSAPRTPYDLVRSCFALGIAPGGGFVRRQDIPGGYVAAGASPADAERFFLQATGLGTYLLQDRARSLLTGPAGPVRQQSRPTPEAVWRVGQVSPDGLRLRSAVSGWALTVGSDGSLQVLPGQGTRLAFVRTTGCTPYPEAATGATGVPQSGTRPDGTVRGIADPHVHVTADLRAGGRTIHGRAFDPLGLPVALGGDEEVHGPLGVLDVTGNLLRTGSPVGTHDTSGWPTFVGWPRHDTNTHQQVYYRWLERTWSAGVRLITAQLIEDEPLCRIEPQKSQSCDEGDTVELQARTMWQLQDYVDAQSGGPGRGWLRLVTSPEQARRVIGDGKLAVLLGVESSNLFGCSQQRGVPACGRADIDREIDRLLGLGIRAVFLAHWVDNALAGAALEGGPKGQLIGAMNASSTGEFFTTGPCPQPGQGEEVEPAAPEQLAAFPLLGKGIPLYPPGKQCNVRGLTDLGRYAVDQLMAKGLLLEADHLSEVGRAELMERSERIGYPLVSSHTHSGGQWTDGELRRLLRNGGFLSATSADTRALAQRVLAFQAVADPDQPVGVGLSTDTGGFATLPGPVGADVAPPLRYPFALNGMRFDRQRTGERLFDLNLDGVAHYGLFADQLAQLRTVPGGPQATALLERSAEAYLRTWEQTARTARRLARD